MIGVRKVYDPRSFGVAEIDEHDRVLRVIEKPVIPRSNMAMVGVYYVKETGRLFAALNAHMAAQGNSEEGEYHLTEALQKMIEEGVRFDAFRVASWFDCGKKETLLSTNATLLRQMHETEDQLPQTMAGGAVIIPPVSIAE